MIAILHDAEGEAAAAELETALAQALAGDVRILLVDVAEVTTWPEQIGWDDVLLVLFQDRQLPDGAARFVTEFRDRRAVRTAGQQRHGGFVLPVALPGAAAKPPAPIEGIKSMPLDVPRVLARIEVMLGAAPCRRDQLAFVSYRSIDGRQIATQLCKDLEGRGFAAWLDEAEENLEGGDDVQDRIDATLERATVLVLVDTPEAIRSKWIRHEIAHAHGQMIPILPVVIGDPRTTRFVELKALYRDVLLRRDGFRPEALSEPELQQVREAFDDLMTDIYRRRQRARSRAEKVFIDNGYTWNAVDLRRRMFASAKSSRRPLPDLRVLSHCSIHDPDYERTAEAVRTFHTVDPVNHRLLVYDYRNGPLPDGDIDILRQNKAFHDLILVHHQELEMLVGSSFQRLR